MVVNILAVSILFLENSPAVLIDSMAALPLHEYPAAPAIDAYGRAITSPMQR